MNASFEIRQGKFTFQVPGDLLYTPEGLWARLEPEGVRIGISDYVQQTGGDVAFAQVREAGTDLRAGEDLASIETIKIDAVYPSPLKGRVLQANPALETTPEVINQDPYGAGWLALIDPAAWAEESARLLEPPGYAALVARQAAASDGARL